jgi:hypothetical protein
MQFLSPTFQWKVLKQPKMERAILFLETLGGSYGFAEEMTYLFEGFCNGFFQVLSSIAMLNFHYARLKHEVYFILACT